jgi:hypothetical protein
MPWRCPACRTEIRHNPADSHPDPNGNYRCHVCRLELRFDARTDKMEVAPFETDHHVTSRETVRTIPPPPFDGRKRKPPQDD